MLSPKNPIPKFLALESIIEKLMDKLKKDLDLDENLPNDSRKYFFTKLQQGNQSRNIMIDMRWWEHRFRHYFIWVLVASVDQLRETIQGVKYVPDGTIYEQSWITAL